MRHLRRNRVPIDDVSPFTGVRRPSRGTGRRRWDPRWIEVDRVVPAALPYGPVPAPRSRPRPPGDFRPFRPVRLTGPGSRSVPPCTADLRSPVATLHGGRASTPARTGCTGPPARPAPAPAPGTVPPAVPVHTGSTLLVAKSCLLRTPSPCRPSVPPALRT
ncbi:hypothetical protein GTW66_02955 [Streptomyces sp. SID5473]|nr:hypothetical protein [Streptomyces sp. SID5473]TAI44033.1 hypothetical protein EWI31_10955 [Streptomyces tsukubensis]